MKMFLHQLRNELLKLFGKKRTYIGFGVFLVAQNAMLLMFHFGRGWKTFYERALDTGSKIAAVGASDSHNAGRTAGFMRSATVLNGASPMVTRK